MQRLKQSSHRALLGFLILLTACATESHRAVQPQTTEVSKTAYYGPKSTLVVGRFQNLSDYLRGIFYPGYDRLGNQAKTILKTHLQQSGRFIVVDRDNMEEIERESAIRGDPQNLKGARVVITGDVTEFGRKVTGDAQLFGILGHGTTQLAYAKVALNVVDVKTSEILFSAQGAGEYDLSNREIIGTGSTAGYDSTLNGKVLNLAIMEAVNHLVDGLEQGRWSP
ncbi:MAG: CsgG/HfaB family protein [Gammaproteobacteria bacterium]